MATQRDNYVRTVSRVLEAIKAGVNNYIVKPFTAESLGEKIAQTMAKIGASA